MGAVILRSMLLTAGLTEPVVVDSAGAGGCHDGHGAAPRTVRVLQEHGYDGTRHRAKEFRREWFSDTDLIVAANKGHVRDRRGRAPDDPSSAKVRPLREFDQTAVESGTLEVDDPYLGNAAGFDHCLKVVERACRGVVEHLGPELPEPADNRS